MAKRVYPETVKKWLIRAGITAGTLIGGIFIYLMAIGAITVTGYSGDVICAGTELDPCYAYINFTAKEDIFIYPTNYDPWGRDTLFNFDPAVKSWKLERSWGKGWREIKLNKTCQQKWCGAPYNNMKDNKYSIAFREGRNYQIRITGYKNNPTDDIKWGAFSGVDEIDPNWFGVDRDIGYEFLDDGKVVHIWNTQDDYFFDKDSGIQFTNHFQDYWSKNIFCIGYYNGGTWNKIKCADELSDFNKDIQTDNSTYVNATLWKDISYGSYDLRFGVGYHLGLNDENLSITIYMKNIGIDIPFDLGFAWKVMDLDVPSNETTDKILINNSRYELDGVYDLTFKDMKKYINNSFPTNQTTGNGSIIYNYSIVEVPIPFYKIYDYDGGLTGKENFLRIAWDENLNYAIKMYGNGNQENFYTALLINAGHFNPAQEKSTTFKWIDAVTDNLVVYWSMNDDFTDSVGSNDLVENGNVNLVAGKIGNGAEMDGNTANFLESTNNIGITGNDARTVTFWAELDVKRIQEAFLSWGTWSQYDAWVIEYYDNAGYMLGVGMHSRAFKTLSDTDTNMNFHVIIYDGTDTLTWLVNNVEVYSGTGQGPPTTADSHVLVGQYPTGTLTMDGIIDEVGIWSRAITTGAGSEAETLWNNGNGLAYPFVSDTCTYVSGNWEVDCSDNCTIESNVDIGGNNITLIGTGHFLLQANITNINKRWLGSGCQIWQELNTNFWYA